VPTPRRPPPPHLVNDAVPEGFSPSIRLLTVDRRQFVTRSPGWLRGLQTAASGKPSNILVLSGGGANAAFGAGVLVGLSKAHIRPQFQLVTGVSAGALLAPFAFLGLSWDAQLRKAFTGGDIEHLQHSIVFGTIGRILFPQGMGGHDLLKALVDDTFTDTMISAIAREAETGRLLIVATTDLDSQEAMLWNMGAIALHGGPETNDLFREVLVASASIPGVFPPVMIRVREGAKIYDEMHVDGSVTTPLFVAPLIAQTVPAVHANLASADVYVIVNGHLAMRPDEVPVNTLKVLERSYSAGLTYETRDALNTVIALAQRDGMHLHMTFLPTTYPSGSFLDFHREHLRQLFGYGEECAKEGLLWTSVAASIQRNVYRHSNAKKAASACPAAVLSDVP